MARTLGTVDNYQLARLACAVYLGYMDAVDLSRRVLIGAIVAVLLAVGVGGVYLWLTWSKVGSDVAPDDTPLTSQQQRRELNSFDAPAPYANIAKDPTTVNAPSSETPSAFDAPSQSSGATAQQRQEEPPTPSSFDAPQ